MATAKKKSISLKEKFEIISKIQSGMKQTHISEQFSLPKSTVNTIWKNRETLKRQFESSEYSNDSKRFRPANHKDVDEALLQWFKQARNNGIPVNGPLLLAKADALAAALNDVSFKATTGFIDRWKTRHGITFKKICGEERSVSPQDTEKWLNITLPQLLGRFSPEDVYNLDETGLFYKLKPDKTLEFKGHKCSGGKKSKERLTVLVGASMVGEKLPLLVIGKAKSPRCFKGVRNLPLEYTANRNAWMTGDIFEDYLKKWNSKLHKAHRSVLVIVDNCTAHPPCLSLSNIVLKFLPPNTTSKLQPCDQGIIQSLKVHYRYQLLQKLLLAMDNVDDIKISVLDAMQWLQYAWDQVTPTTIQNCFHHVGFRADSSAPIEDDNSEPDISGVLDELKENGMNIDCEGDEFAAIDSTVITTGELSDQDIAASIQETTQELGDAEDQLDDDDPVLVPTYSEYKTAVDVVKRFVTCMSSNPQDMVAVQTLEHLLFTMKREQQQTTLDSFLQTN